MSPPSPPPAPASSTTNLGNVLSDESELTGQLYGSRCCRDPRETWSRENHTHTHTHTRYARPLRGDRRLESRVRVPRCLSSSTFIRDFRRMIEFESRFPRKRGKSFSILSLRILRVEGKKEGFEGWIDFRFVLLRGKFYPRKIIRRKMFLRSYLIIGRGTTSIVREQVHKSGG